MVSFKNAILIALTCCFLACSDQKTTTTKQTTITETTVAEKPPMVGGDSDEHGCKASAGFQWSQIKNECIQIFNAGIRLNPQAKDLDQTLSAFVVFKSDTDDTKAELFIPNASTSLLLEKVKKEDAGVWKNENYILSQWKGMYSLEDNKKKLLYQGTAK
jgi:hypothetical protein